MTMKMMHYNLLLLLVCLLLAVNSSSCFVALVPTSTIRQQGLQWKTSSIKLAEKFVMMQTTSRNNRLLMSTPSLQPPSSNPQNNDKVHEAIVLLTATLLALAITLTNPLPLFEENNSHQYSFLSLPHIVISKLEVTPLGGGGFGGMGIGPGFMPIPFGGFGFGFSIKNKPPPPTEQQVLEARKQELYAVKQYQQTLEGKIQAMEQQKPPAAGNVKPTLQKNW